MVARAKMYYSISEVCREVGLEQHVLRYWESEFPSLKPKKNRAGNRAYRKKEIDLVKYIKFLLYDKKYTIQGAKKVVSGSRDGAGIPAVALAPQSDLRLPVLVEQETNYKGKIDEIKNDLLSLLSLVKNLS